MFHAVLDSSSESTDLNTNPRKSMSSSGSAGSCHEASYISRTCKLSLSKSQVFRVIPSAQRVAEPASTESAFELDCETVSLEFSLVGYAEPDFVETAGE